jgi:CspA family cold shock protein
MSRGDVLRLTATVKWFNRSKGFGFVTPADGSSDVFLPASVLENAGHDEVGEGVTITCDVAEGIKGRAIVDIIEVDQSTARPRARTDNGGGFRPRGDGERFAHPPRSNAPTGPTESLDGVVKWFDGARGFGFISPGDGGKDIFVHVSALRRSGLETLVTGQTVRIQVAEARRGREATSVEVF